MARPGSTAGPGEGLTGEVMFKKIATGMLAFAAAGAVAVSMPAAAVAGSYDYSEHWGSVHSKNHLAKAKGWVGVEWDEDQTSNTVHVRGKLYDLDKRTYKQGGKCAYVKFQTDRKSTRLNSSHVKISYAVFCLKKKRLQHRLRSGGG